MAVTPDADPPSFERDFHDASRRFTRIGPGSIGGKAEGLWRIRERILGRIDLADHPWARVQVPTLAVVGADHFRSFIVRNRLSDLLSRNADDDRIAHVFQRAELPAELVGDLRALIGAVHTPLAVRSSSRLEDALDHPFAGVYTTKMIPNNEIEEDLRFRRIESALKLVYASTWFGAARSAQHAAGVEPVDEAMAVILQEVVGRRRGDRFYPTVSAVARSWNFYPPTGARPEDGVVSLALGLGKTIVDGGVCWSYSPAAPAAPPPFNDVGELLDNTQRRFWAVHMGPPPLPDPIRETECMIQADLATAESDGVLRYLVSTYDAGADRLYPGLASRGPRAVTFAPLLAGRLLPFPDLVRALVAAAEEEMGGPVEIELAVTLDDEADPPVQVGFLQVRAMQVANGETVVEASELDAADAVVATGAVLGHGRRDDIRDVVYLPPERFDRSATPVIAKQVETVNRQLVEAGRPYLLIGFGRWGTSDPWLGIPTAWGQISGARVIVESTLPDVRPELSQGSHFFHNLLAFHILYLSVEHDGPHPVDWSWLARCEEVSSSDHVRHVQTSEPLDVRVDGGARRGVIRHHGRR